MRTRILGAGERMAATLALVQEIAIAQAGTTGRKNLIWIRQGFPSVDGALLDWDQLSIRSVWARPLLGKVLLLVVVGGSRSTPFWVEFES